MAAGTVRTTLLAGLAGAAGGLLGFLLSEFLASDFRESATIADAIAGTAVWCAWVAAAIALVLGGADNVLGVRGRWFRGLWWVAPLGFALGLVSGAVGQVSYSALGPNRLTRGLAWALMGAGIGLVLGALDRSWAKAARGLVGGFVGGAIGGLLFDSFTFINFGPSDDGRFARFVGLTVLGAAIGLTLRAAQELLKSAWLLGTSTGPYEGKQYILAKPVVTVGRSDACDVALYHERDLPARLGTLRRAGKEWRWEGEPVDVNGQLAHEATVRAGDRLRFGNTVFRFEARGATPQREFTEALALHGNAQVVPLPVPLRRVALGGQGDVRLTGSGVEARHAELRVQDGELWLIPHAPTLVNDRPVPTGRGQAVQVGDLIRLGDEELALLKLG